MDNKGESIRTDWEKDYQIESVDSVCLYERYSFLDEDRCINVRYKFNVTQELIEDIGLKEVLSQVEQWHMLVEIYKTCSYVFKAAMDDKSFKMYMPGLQSYLLDLQKAEGAKPNNAYYGSNIFDLPAYDIKKICSEIDTLGKKIVFQRRIDWQLCESNMSDVVTVRSRFQFCVIEKQLKQLKPITM